MTTKTMELKFERQLATTPREALAAWLNPKVPGSPWNVGEKLILQAKVGGFFYWLVNATPHYGRFLKLNRTGLVAHTWMSPYTEGLESTVTVTFAKQGDGTLMTLTHSGLPDSSKGKAHVEGWTDFLDTFPKFFLKKTRGKKSGPARK
jgi:Activator of Hsp90 ATPase homolog 1-like protein